MPLSVSDRLGAYEIIALIGKGGMGEVYRARDTKLKRDVALKVLPETFARDPEHMLRLQHEAEMLALLNHPNIAAIYGIEESGGVRALVMELVDGESPKGPMGFDDAWKICGQIAEALEYAHEHGVIHRDLKPANVKVTPGGIVKLLDFGLAKAFSTPTEPAAVTENAATLTLSATEPGVILGTTAYMAPEQARGKAVDKRVDIWAFGVVVYELLTGQRLFKGENVRETLAEVLTKEPDLSRVPPQARKLLRRCLEKDPKERLRDIGEARFLLEERPVEDRHVQSRPWAIAAGAMVLLAAILGLAWWRTERPPPTQPLMSLNVVLEDGTPLARNNLAGVFALSPDGTRLALTLRGADGKVRLHIRLLNQSVVTPLAGTENASAPFFSPDGKWIGFFADGKLKKIAIEGGPITTLSDARNARGGSWGDDNYIVAALLGGGVLSRIPSTGGTPVPVTKLKPGEATHRYPQVLPGSQAVLLTVSSQFISYDDATIDVVSLKTGERKTVLRGGFSPHYLAASDSKSSGYLIYLHQSTLLAVPFNLGRLAATGAPVPILEDVGSNGRSGGDFDFVGAPSGSGTFVYLAGKGQGGWPISWLDSSGNAQPLHAPPGNYRTPRFSPDGKRLAFAIGSAQGADIWVKDLERDTPSRLTFLPGQNVWPVWNPDGRNIVFQSINPDAPGLYSVRSDGSGTAQRLTDGKLQEWPYSFSPDGVRLAFVRFDIGRPAEIL